MKVLVVGGGGREHAIIRKLKEAEGGAKALLRAAATGALRRTPNVCPSRPRTCRPWCEWAVQRTPIDYVRGGAGRPPCRWAWWTRWQKAGIPGVWPQ